MKKRNSIGSYYVGQENAVLYPVKQDSCGFATNGERLVGTILALFETSNFGYAVLEISGKKRIVCIG